MAALDATESALLRDRWPNLADAGDAERVGVVAEGNETGCGTGLLPGLSLHPLVPRNETLSAFSLAMGLNFRVPSLSLYLRASR